MKKKCSSSRKKRFHLLILQLYRIGKVQNMPVLAGRLVILLAWPLKGALVVAYEVPVGAFRRLLRQL